MSSIAGNERMTITDQTRVAISRSNFLSRDSTPTPCRRPPLDHGVGVPNPWHPAQIRGSVVESVAFSMIEDQGQALPVPHQRRSIELTFRIVAPIGKALLLPPPQKVTPYSRLTPPRSAEDQDIAPFAVSPGPGRISGCGHWKPDFELDGPRSVKEHARSPHNRTTY
jgi:hypothetical protein